LITNLLLGRQGVLPARTSPSRAYREPRHPFGTDGDNRNSSDTAFNRPDRLKYS
jgi:hypothetical protein